MAKFEVQEFCLCGGWTNTWSDGEGNPTYFDSDADAWSELESFMRDMRHEFEQGNVVDTPDRDDFRIVEVTNDSRTA